MARISLVAGSLLAAMFAGGCNPASNLIDHVSFQPTTNHESLRVSVVFTKTIETVLVANFTLADYGFLFVNPFSATQPFEVGFSLDTDIFNDANISQLPVTHVLPNGLPLSVKRGMTQVSAPSPVSADLDLYGYVDVSHKEWLGSAAIFNFINDQYFPNGLSVSQVFWRDSQGAPGVIAGVFGPTVDHAGKMTRAGGIALFANVKQLLASQVGSVDFRPQGLPVVEGPRAPAYDGQYTRLRALEANLVRAFNHP